MMNFVIGSLGLFGFGIIFWFLFERLMERISLPLYIPAPPRLLPKTLQLDKNKVLLVVLTIFALLLGVFVDLVDGFLALVLGSVLYYFLSRQKDLLEKYKKNKKLAGLRDLFPQALGMFIQALKTGQTIPQVLGYLSRESPSPLREEFSMVCAEMSLGLSTESALTKMQERYPEFDEFRQFLESYKISGQTGANLTHLLQVLLSGMEEKGRLLRKMGAMTAQARLSGLVMGALPFLLGLVFFLMDPHLMTPLFTTKGGFFILFTASIFETIGFLWIRQLLRLEA